MEAKSNNNNGVAQVRRLHIIYFLSRKGRIEQPHLIRVHHLSRNGGIRLRDIKRWLSELRGNDMPESFAWSYKRRYKHGYVWQDLVDEDLITPISDNEYVLKGSEIFPIDSDGSICGKKVPMQKKASLEEEEEAKEKPKQENCEIEQETQLFSSESSTMSDDSRKFEELLNKKVMTKKKDTNNAKIEKKNTPSPPSSSSSPSISKSKSKRHSSQIFRNLITCGTVDTRDSTVVAMNRRKKPSLNASCDEPIFHASEICKMDKLGGSQRIYGTPWMLLEHNDNNARKSCKEVPESLKFCTPRTSSAAFMPLNGPTCLQCGKQFKPEKLHKHMKSCKGMKAATSKGVSADFSAEKTSQQVSTESSQEHSISGYYLTH